jgi:hypothetical protein
MCDKEAAQLHGDILVLSNISYLVPAAVAAYRATMSKTLSPEAASELIPWYVSVAFIFSWSYHACRTELAKKNQVDPCQTSFDWTAQGQCNQCPISGLQYARVPYDRASVLDRVFANYAVLLTLIHAIPLTDQATHIYRSLGLIWIAAAFLANPQYEDELALICFLPLAILFLMYWAQTRHNQSRNMTWSVAMFLIAVAVSALFMPGYYYLAHPIWHIGGALAAAMALSGGADRQVNELPPGSTGLGVLWYQAPDHSPHVDHGIKT